MAARSDIIALIPGEGLMGRNVSEADTTALSYRQIRDLIGLFDAGQLRLDLERLT
jgi:hypothetical protein